MLYNNSHYHQVHAHVVTISDYLYTFADILENTKHVHARV